MTGPGRSGWLRENSPVIGVGALLLLALALLMMCPIAGGGGFNAPSPASADNAQVAAPSLAALPAANDGLAQDSTTLAPNDARMRNDTIAFADTALAPSSPFVFAGNAQSRERATHCLALVAMAEAGADDAGQRAVMQVVLNRVRHPAFKQTVCGVVFEGSERRTGCQFTFTCDGSLARIYSPARWSAARQRAAEALGGRVFAAVGNATHYHTDWVHPWWSAKLDKIAQVDTHLFLRWRGFWGTPAAMTKRYRGGEPQIAALMTPIEALAEKADAQPDEARANEPARSKDPVVSITSNRRVTGSLPAGPGAHFLLLDRAESPDAIILRAQQLCPGTAYCQVYGWTEDAIIPARLPLPDEARRALRFSFTPERPGIFEVVYFDCSIYPVQRTRCLPRARN